MKSQCVLFYLPMESPLNGREYFPMNSPIFSWWFSETIIKSSKFQILLINSIRIGFVGKILTGNHRFPHYSYGAFRFKIFPTKPIHWSMSTLFSSQNQLLPAPWRPKQRQLRTVQQFAVESRQQHHERRAELMGWTMGWSKKNRISSAFHSFLVLFQ